MRVLVTGATGFIGRALLRAASERGRDLELVALARPGGAPNESPDGVRWAAADLSAQGFERDLPSQIDAVVHLAQSRGYRDFPDQALDVLAVNVTATGRLIEYARAHGATRFLLASTATVYEASAEPLDEASPLDTASLYAASKRGAELLLGPYAGVLACRAFRIFTTYGPGQRGMLVRDLTERVRDQRPVTVRGERGLALSPIHVDDVCAGLLAGLGGTPAGPGAPEILNLGGAEALGILEIAEAIGEAVGRRPVIEHEPGPDPGGYTAERTRFERAFPALARPVGFAQGIRSTLELESAAI